MEHLKMARRALNGNPTITTHHGESGYGYFGRHAGYDYGIVGWEVIAPEAATVTAVYTGRDNVDGGNIVEIRSSRYDHRFLHLKSVNVRVGQRINEGDVLGISGNTGNVGYHLHHDVRTAGTGWKDAYSNYVDWEAIIKTQGDDMPIPNADNYFHRYNKAMVAIRGREISREEFNKNFVGSTDLHMLEVMLDHPEADQATEYQNIGRMAKNDQWQQQIYDRTRERDEARTAVDSAVKENLELHGKIHELELKLENAPQATDEPSEPSKPESGTDTHSDSKDSSQKLSERFIAFIDVLKQYWKV